MTDQSATSPAGTRTPAKRVPIKALVPMIPFALRYKGRIAGALAALIVASAATLVIPAAAEKMIDNGFSADNAGLVDRYFAGMLVVVAVLAMASGARYFCVMALGERVVADIRSQLFAHLTRLDAAFFDAAKTGELVSRLSADTTQMKSAFGASASIALRNLFLFLGAIVLMVVSSPKLSGFVLIAIPIIVLPLVAAGRAIRGRSRSAQDTLAEATAFAAENLGAIRTIQAFGTERATAGRFSRAVDEAYQAALNATKARAVLTIIAIFLAFASVVAVLWLGAQDVIAGRMTSGDLTKFVLYAVFGASSLGQLSEVWSEISAAAGAAGRIAEILQVAPHIVAPPHPVALPHPVKGEIVFDAVQFAYPTRSTDAVLHGLTFTVRPGETVALVGPSGAGKSTVFQLIMRFYDPSAGRVLLDGTDIAAVDPDALRAEIAMVQQDPVIFGASIAENIRYGRTDASDAEVIHAAERAAADGFIRALPEGYATRIGERGVTLSGGQRQRIAIARAILKNSPVLLLDEATSALDAENEMLVQAALENIMHDRTTLVIAHRLATALQADRILVVEDGRIVEEGTHTSLVVKNGLYARLARLQFETGAAALGEPQEGVKAAE